MAQSTPRRRPLFASRLPRGPCKTCTGECDGQHPPCCLAHRCRHCEEYGNHDKGRFEDLARIAQRIYNEDLLFVQISNSQRVKIDTALRQALLRAKIPVD